MLRTGLLAVWAKCQHRFLVITFLFNFCHTDCFISEFHFWLRNGISSIVPEVSCLTVDPQGRAPALFWLGMRA